MKPESSRIWWGAAVLLLVAVASALGGWVGQRFSNRPFAANQPIVLKAETAATGNTISMATGLVDRQRLVEGLFVLDHLSGRLQCWLINPRTGDIGGIYSTNVARDLDLAKGADADYVMVTGSVKFEIAQTRIGNRLPAATICYVCDGNTGKVVGYTLYYDRQLQLNNLAEEGSLDLVVRGFAREAGLQRDN